MAGFVGLSFEAGNQFLNPVCLYVERLLVGKQGVHQCTLQAQLFHRLFRSLEKEGDAPEASARKQRGKQGQQVYGPVIVRQFRYPYHDHLALADFRAQVFPLDSARYQVF